MKIFLMILSIFFLKTTADAQDWGRISPASATGLKKMQVVHTENGDEFILAYNDTTLFIRNPGSSNSWKAFKSILLQCVTPPTTEYSKFIINGFIVDENGYAYVVNDGRDCYNPDGSLTYIMKYDLNAANSVNKVLEKTSCSFGTVNSAIALTTQGEKYILSEKSIFYFDTLPQNENIFSLPSYSVPNPENLLCGPVNSNIFSSDPRKSRTIYMSVRTKQKDGEEFDYTDYLFKNDDRDSTWELITTLPVYRDITFSGGFSNIGFPDADSSLVFMTSEKGLLRYNTSTQKLDTVFEKQVMAVSFSKNPNLTFILDEFGRLYYSQNFGETWNEYTKDRLNGEILNLYDLYAAGFPKGPIYAATKTGVYEITPDIVLSAEDSSPFKNNNELTITPNPANTALKISFLKTELPQQLSIYNSLGQLIFKTEFSGEFVWDFNNEIGDGVYTVAVQSGGNSVAKQVVILR